MPAFIMAIFLSAFLLFQVQPIVARYILPLVRRQPGGVDGMHALFPGRFVRRLRLRPRTGFRILRNHRRAQVGVHLVLLAVSMVMLPITPDEALKPTGDANPVARHRLVAGEHRRSSLPRRLGLGAPAATLVCGGRRRQVAIPPLRGLQSRLAVGAAELSVRLRARVRIGPADPPVVGRICGVCDSRRCLRAGCSGRGATVAAREPAGRRRCIPARGTKVLDRILWVALPACGSVLLLATTSQMTQDVAVVPFLWVIPLGSLPGHVHHQLRPRPLVQPRGVDPADDDLGGRAGLAAEP